MLPFVYIQYCVRRHTKWQFREDESPFFRNFGRRGGDTGRHAAAANSPVAKLSLQKGSKSGSLPSR